MGVFAWSIFQHAVPIDVATVNAFAAYFLKNLVAGFLAGWVLDLGLGIYRGTGACLGLLLGLFLFDALAFALGANPLEAMLSELFLSFGWALGLVMCRYSDEVLARR